jgi:hypothetical protein
MLIVFLVLVFGIKEFARDLQIFNVVRSIGDRKYSCLKTHSLFNYLGVL